MLHRLDARPLLGTITIPTLVVVGRQDEWSPVPQHETIARSIPGAHLEVIENSGHMVTLEQPEAVSATLAAWLSNLPDC